jgi:hypothetical protein
MFRKQATVRQTNVWPGITRSARLPCIFSAVSLLITVWAQPIQISGRYPHLAMFNQSPEVGVGAVVEWQDRLWIITYSPHRPGGSDDKLYILDADLKRETFAKSVGGTPANRLIHRESRQLFIGPYVVDEQRHVRVIPMGERPQDATENRIYGRLTATARHLIDPANKVYHFDMEGVLYEVNVHTLDIDLLYVRPIPGWHAKGGYTAQGRLILANNGERGAADPARYGAFEYQIDPTQQSAEDVGALADWDGAEEWRLIRRRQFTEVTGPGGIQGAPSEEAPAWATGWDKRSLILMVMQDGEWDEFRMPKADYSYDGYHGWHTEWPRIREAVPASSAAPARLLMNKHGGLFVFPHFLTAADTSGLRPLGSYLKVISDFQAWNGRIVFACNETSMFDNPLAGQAQSNLWFSDWEALRELGNPAGWGGVWMEDDVPAGARSVPYLVGGYEQRVLHLAHQTERPVRFRLEIDRTGSAQWEFYRTIEVPAGGYAFHILPSALECQWMRLAVDSEVVAATAYFHYGPSRGAITDDRKFVALADVDRTGAYTSAIIRPRGADMGTLHLLAHRVDDDGRVTEVGHYEIDQDMVLQHQPQDTGGAGYLRERGTVDGLGYEIDKASVIVRQGERRYRLPKGDWAYDEEWPAGWPRSHREVVTERSLLNAHGTIYMRPRDNSGGIRALKPITTHNKRITDFCSWRGMLVLAGTWVDGPEACPQFVRSTDGQVGLWFGDIDDLWKLGKPRGVGGPWHETEVQAGAPSDPYLMTGYDRKRVELRHDQDRLVTFQLEVDLFGAVDTPETYFLYERIPVPAGEGLIHEFPEGYGAHWIRLIADTDCVATAIFTYE